MSAPAPVRGLRVPGGEAGVCYLLAARCAGETRRLGGAGTPGWAGCRCQGDLRIPGLRLSLPRLPCAGLPEVFTLAATLLGKQRGKEQEVMFRNSVCYLIRSLFSAAEVGGSGGFFLPRAPPRNPFY